MLVMEDTVKVFAGDVIVESGLWFSLTSDGIRVEDQRKVIDFIETMRFVEYGDGSTEWVQSVQTKVDFEIQVAFWLREYQV